MLRVSISHPPSKNFFTFPVFPDFALDMKLFPYMIIMAKTLLGIYHISSKNKRYFFEDLLMRRDVSVKKDICRYLMGTYEKVARFTSE
jgi:hypothetical protein